ncbi:MAG: helix-turn-helix domain-containing protein [Clostridiales Family XIII bacterium]|jgi:AraC family transcriptional regulator of adaptative response / DNA-3-methyladenine glycosylase II|nr:helix-turn-helix domain-containing protein [Clostridiales Family XIII bacterium]
MLEESCGNDDKIDKIAGRLGYTARHLRRVFTEAYNVPPIRYRQTCRLLLAKSLLTDTDLPILEIAMASGFGSLRRFNDLFKERYRLSPTALRKRASAGENPDGGITLALGYRPPYRWEAMLHFLSGRAIPGVETVKDGAYLRTAHFVTAAGKRIYGCLRVRDCPAKNTLSVTISENLLPVLSQVLACVKRLFDLHCDPIAVYETLSPMNDLRPGLCVLGTRLPGCFDAFEMSVRAVLGQQITVKAARTLAARIADAYGTRVQTGTDGLTHVFPSPENVLELGASVKDRFGELGVSSARSETIGELARMFSQNEIDFHACPRPEEEIKKLTAIRGIGNRTARYIAMRAIGWTDAFLETDAGVKKALQPLTSKEPLKRAEAWRPWRSYAVVNLWNAL